MFTIPSPTFFARIFKLAMYVECGKFHCIHGKFKYSCKECGTGYCEHRRSKYDCADCGTGRCEHGCRIYICKLCKGGNICIHNEIRSRCKECTPLGYLASNVGSRVRGALKERKSKSTMEYLNCDIEDFRYHIESQFKQGMTW